MILLKSHRCLPFRTENDHQTCVNLKFIVIIQLTRIRPHKEQMSHRENSFPYSRELIVADSDQSTVALNKHNEGMC